ncbi:hydroxymethylglutaryl-CoA lyase [Dyadobacter sediminis]|uniref:Hydroxymethylglutaryl-CoA lyase n=1 Tax=Dyadobacter sediminis TaxID=1493691 RepID=A0A5R9K8W1_9BACT|nr:hydroxymethylglutaryl-CoA lyase [Dyadobacter sediminis]TLU90478.1 hydroxymethylglutaryl-CoA lyase [Dyadobacter sediminis]GGC08055.1 hydroxymethylglutaryl-CoA lyase [Dyadobacter sediminis]
MKIIECPRDAWQGFPHFIPTEKKAAYLNQLLKVGFHTIDFGSFVSPKAMPQVSDTARLLDHLDLSGTDSRLLAIVANERGAMEACRFGQIQVLGYPFSISETFQLRNANATVRQSFEKTRSIAALCTENGKELVIYISMGFGNPYGDFWNVAYTLDKIHELAELGITKFSLADTIGIAREDDIHALFSQLIAAYPNLEFGAHFHSKPGNWRQKINAAYTAGCRRFDGVLLGYGGCPMAQDELVGNIPTEHLIAFADEKKELLKINSEALVNARELFLRLVSAYAQG